MVLEKWKNEIDQITESVDSHFKDLTNEELNKKPNPDKWSIAQHLDHLQVINRTYYPTFNAIIDGKYKRPWVGKIGWIVNLIGKMILKSVQPDEEKKIKTIAIWEPEKKHIDKDVITLFTAHQTELKAILDQLSDFFNNGVVIASPANKNIVYKLEDAIDIIIAHEKRHLKHILELKS